VKRLTREQVEGRKEKAARFTEVVLGDSDRADDIRDESIEDYAERRRFEITNPTRRCKMPSGSRDPQREQIKDLKEQIRDLEEENESLQDQLDSIAEIVAPDEPEESEDDDDPE
jgi:predicted RNase H-like nuclease (RuvC/YqgF family)